MNCREKLNNLYVIAGSTVLQQHKLRLLLKFNFFLYCYILCNIFVRLLLLLRPKVAKALGVPNALHYVNKCRVNAISLVYPVALVLRGYTPRSPLTGMYIMRAFTSNDNLNTESAKKFAKPLIEFIIDYIKQLNKEIENGQK